MSGPRLSFARTYLAFAGVALVSAGILAGLGCLVAGGLSVDRGCRSVLAGCGISLVASLGGALPITVALVGRSRQMVNAILGSTVIRFATVIVLIIPLMLSGWFDRPALVISVAASYFVMLLLDTSFAVRAVKRLSES